MTNLSEICFNITRRCNLHCSNCYVYDYINQNNNNMMMDLSLDKMKTIIDHSSVNIVYLSGGEPFMHPNIKDIISYLTNVGIKVNIATNGQLLNEEMCCFLNHKNISLLISLREEHEKTFQIIKMLESYQIQVVCYHIPTERSSILIPKLVVECPSVKKIKLLYDSRYPKSSFEWFSILNKIYNNLKYYIDDIVVEVEIAFLPKTNIIAKGERRGAFDRIQVSTEGLLYYCPLLVCNKKGVKRLPVPKCVPEICPVLSKHLDDDNYASVCCFLVSSLENAIKIGKSRGAI